MLTLKGQVQVLEGTRSGKSNGAPLAECTLGAQCGFMGGKVRLSLTPAQFMDLRRGDVLEFTATAAAQGDGLKYSLVEYKKLQPAAKDVPPLSEIVPLKVYADSPGQGGWRR